MTLLKNLLFYLGVESEIKDQLLVKRLFVADITWNFIVVHLVIP